MICLWQCGVRGVKEGQREVRGVKEGQRGLSMMHSWAIPLTGASWYAPSGSGEETCQNYCSTHQMWLLSKHIQLYEADNIFHWVITRALPPGWLSVSG